MAGKGTPAVNAARAAGLTFRLLEYDYDSSADAIGLHAAASLGLDPSVVFKTLVAQVDGKALVCAVIPVAARLDLKALAAAAGGRKADLADPAVAERSSGYTVGGISPLGQRRPLPTFIDNHAEGLAEMVVNGGRRGLQIALAPGDLIRAARATLCPLTVRDRHD